MYKAVIFDLGRVLVNFDFKRGYRALEELCPYPAAEIPKRLSTCDLVQRFETGLVEPHDFVTQMSAMLDLRIDYDHFCRIWDSIFTEILVPEAMLAGLAARYRLVLLSNTNAIHFVGLRETHTNLLRHFHSLVLSYEVKAMKPQPAIFQAAIERAGCRPEECFYTDDIADYVKAAQTFGIDAVQFESLEKLQRDLSAREIRWE